METSDAALTPDGSGTSEDGTKAELSDSGSLTFTAPDGMEGGKLEIGGTTLSFDASGNITIPSGGVNVGGTIGNLVITSVTGPVNGVYTVEYTYTQTGQHNHGADGTATDLEAVVESYDVKVTDAHGTAASKTDAIQVTINDDAPSIIGDEAAGEPGHGETEATVTNNEASANLAVAFGADDPGKIIFPASSIGTYEAGVKWDGTNWVAINTGDTNFTDLSFIDSNGDKVYKFEYGDVILTSTDNENWTITYPTPTGDRDVELEFVDGDGDSVNHTITAETDKQPDIENLDGQMVDTIHLLPGHGQVYWSTSGGVPNIAEGVKYDESTGIVINTGWANDDVWLGDGADTVYLGESYAEDFDANETTEQASQKAMENFMQGEDSEHLQDANNEDSALVTSKDSNAYLDIGHGGGGDDTIYGEGGIDAIFGGSGNDKLYGGEGNDGLRGGTGNDLLDGGTGDDILYGGDGNDILIGGLGADTLRGGKGNDLLELDLADLLVDGGTDDAGDDLDILLGGTEADKNDVFNALGNKEIVNVEMIVLGKDVESDSNVEEVLKDLGLSKDQLGTELKDTNKWTEGETKNGFVEYTSKEDENVTILVESSKLTTS